MEKQSLLDNFTSDKDPLHLNAATPKATWWQTAPQILFLTIIGTILLVGIIDYKEVMAAFSLFVDWIKQEPTSAALAIILLYATAVVLTIPISPITIALSLAFNQAFATFFGK